MDEVRGSLHNLIDYIHSKGNIKIVTLNQGLELVGNQIDMDEGFAINGKDLRFNGTIYRTAGTTLSTFLHTYYDPATVGFNTFLGYQAGNLKLSGSGGASYLASYNSSFGYQSLTSLTSGYENSAFGFQGLWKTTSGYKNTAVGRSSLSSTTSGYNNTAIGYFSGFSNSTGNSNTYIGNSAGFYHTGNGAVYIGNQAGMGVSGRNTGNYNIAIGQGSLFSIRGAAANTSIGFEALNSDSTGQFNSATGYQALNKNFSGNENTASGAQAGFFTTGSGNTFAGSHTGYGTSGLSTGSSNTSMGNYSLNKYTTGQQNSIFGSYSGFNNTTGSFNTFIGAYSGYSNLIGTGNVFIGYQAGYYQADSNKLFIANKSTTLANATTSDGILIFGDFRKNYLNIFNKVAIGKYTIPTDALEVTGNIISTGYIKTGTGYLNTEDPKPDVSGYSTYIFNYSQGSVTLESLSHALPGVYYTLIGTSDINTLILPETDKFRLNNIYGQAILGLDDSIVLYCMQADYFIEISRSDN